MKVLASFCLSLVLCQVGRASVLPGQVEKQPLVDVIHYNSGLKTFSPLSSDSSLLTSCNGVLNATSGGIAYRAFEPIAENERCVWTIRGGNAGGFSLNVLNLGISNSSSNTQVIATCLRRGETLANHILLNQTGPVNGVSYCNVLVITFASGSEVSGSTGFVLEYSVLRSSSLSPRSQDYIIDAGTAGIIRHPNSASRYENYELNTFIILPTLGSNTNVIYFRGSLEADYCYDNLSVYRFNATSVAPTKWEYKGRICGHILSDFISNGDLILITFDTDQSVVGTGFQLAIAPSDAAQCQN
ncbi:Exoskeleton protein RP43 [Orchesella cincta]|uniref:Exoskeleton protein RP43 n=1 Tax=Orchesella cincta TaxID=48709 RepID=A0A1D2M8E8_ORCCI|nr:Exoskeleton protein RP43 [Orchesella cincta]